MTPLATLATRSWRILAIAAALGALAAAVATVRLPPRVDIAMTFTIPIPERPPSAEYEYDGYYALQAADLFSSTLASWISSPDVVADAYDGAGLKRPAVTVRRLASAFTARKLSGQLVDVRMSARSRDEALALVHSLVTQIQRRVDDFNDRGRDGLTFTILAGDPLIVSPPRSPGLRALVGAIVAVVLVGNGILLWDMLRSGQTSA